jgi:glutamate/tyrosine decarboxylase-like PLP-dependent enzyme
MSGELALPPDAIRELGSLVTEFIVSYYESLSSRPVLEPVTSARLRELLQEPLPAEGAEIDAVLATLRDVVLRYSRHSAHPRFFGYVASPGAPVAALGSAIEAALNSNVTSWRSSPAGTEMEHLATDWLKQMLGYPAAAGGLFVSGGSTANFAGLAAARSARVPEVVKKGLRGPGAPLRVYVSEEAHYSIGKAAAMLGIGEDNVVTVATDSRLRMDVQDLERKIRADIDAGYGPLCVAANAGAVACGSVDPFTEIAGIARAYGLWFHVDACYGGFGALAPATRHLFQGIGEADSVALDPHKWLYLPMGCGCVLYKDPATARAAFSHSAEYTKVIGLERDEAFAFWDYGPELSRPFRALNVWLLIKTAGTRRISEAVAENIACAKHFESLVKESGDFEMLAPVELSIFCFRCAPRGFTGDLDALNERILVNLQRAGNSYLSNARIKGRFALRGCVLNYRTTRRDMEILLDDVRAAARTAAAQA